MSTRRPECPRKDGCEDEQGSKIWDFVGEIKFRPFVQNGAAKEPLSASHPEPSHEAYNTRLIAELHRQGGFELKERNSKRKRIFDDINNILSNWALEHLRHRGLDAIHAYQACQTMPFGSYCIGVHQAESDIDILCIVPMPILRHEFFTEIPRILAACDKIDKSTMLTASAHDFVLKGILFQYLLTLFQSIRSLIHH